MTDVAVMTYWLIVKDKRLPDCPYCAEKCIFVDDRDGTCLLAVGVEERIPWHMAVAQAILRLRRGDDTTRH